MATNKKHPGCPWSTAQVRERVDRKIHAMFGHRRGYEIQPFCIREMIAMGTIAEAWGEHTENTAAFSDGPPGVVIERDCWRATKAAFFDAFGLTDAEDAGA